ncbi:ATP-binding protein [Actinosynnema sp. NPDC050801]|uniref:ATP-binding protein n=1 Tax=unclassified Actinosynnema TaxID=2637065 RepID=UPI0033C92424
MRPLDGVNFHRVLAVPGGMDPDPRPAQLFAALTAAHVELAGSGADRPVLATAWLRRPRSERVHVLVGGRPRFPPAGDDALLYPPGSVGEPVPGDEVEELFGEFGAWLRCTGQADSLWLPGDEGNGIPQRRGGFDDYVVFMGQPFAWVVVAEPVPSDAVEFELLSIANEVPRLRQRENSQSDRVALERAEGRYRELSRARVSGMWNVHVFVGADTESNARRAAALLCSSGDLDELPYALRPGADVGSLDEVDAAPVRAVDGASSPFSGSSELLSILARPPVREVPGVRLVERAEFDLTSEVAGSIPLGSVLDTAGRPVGELSVGAGTVNRHVFVAGATGSGKSQTVRHLLEGLHRAGVPWLVIEPAKAEYARMAGRLWPDGEVAVIRPGDPGAVPLGLNPLEPEPGFPLQTHVDLVRELFLAAFQAEEPFPQVLAQALTRSYEEYGWNLTLSSSRFPRAAPRYPTLRDLQNSARRVVDEIGYGKEISANVRGFVDVRLGSLRLGTPGRFFEGGLPLDVADLLRRNVVLEIEDVGNDQDKAFFIGAVLIRLVEHLRMRRVPGPVRLRHVTVVEEAHRLLKNVLPGSPASHAVEMFAALLAEIRAYGEGVVIAEQIPAKIIPDVLKNTALKIVHRLPAADDREAVGATMNLDEVQSRHVVSLPPGRAAVFADGMDRPVLLGIPLGEDRESVDVPLGTVRGVGMHTVACRPECRATPCTLREISEAWQVAQQPELTTWVELLVLSHVIGYPSPMPVGGWLARLDGDLPQLERAVGLLAQRAVDVRYRDLVPFYDPDHLAAHVAVRARERLAGGGTGCGVEVEWQAGPYRWHDVLVALHRTKTAEAHPDTASWAERGLVLAGRTRDEQYAELLRRSNAERDLERVFIGRDRPDALTAATREYSGLEDPVQALRAVLPLFEPFPGNWPIRFRGKPT